MSWPDTLQILEVRIGYVANDQQCYNVLHYYVNESGPAADSPLELAEDVVTKLSADGDTPGSLIHSMRLLMSTSVNITTIAAQGIWSPRFRSFTGEVAGFPGLLDAPCDAQNVAAVIQKYGEGGDRRNVGTIHLGGLGNIAYEDGEMTADSMLIMDQIGDAYLEGLTVPTSDPEEPITYSPAILNRTLVVVDGRNTWPITGYKEVVGTTSKKSLRVMRRRTKGYGI